MENKQYKQTKFDSMVTNKNLQLVKAVIPYINNNLAAYLGMYIKYQELMNASHINYNLTVSSMDSGIDLESLLNEIMEYMEDDEKENMENIFMTINMMKEMGEF